MTGPSCATELGNPWRIHTCAAPATVDSMTSFLYLCIHTCVQYTIILRVKESGGWEYDRMLKKALMRTVLLEGRLNEYLAQARRSWQNGCFGASSRPQRVQELLGKAAVCTTGKQLWLVQASSYRSLHR